MPSKQKLVRIDHSRCGEYDGMEFMLAPDDWSEDFITSEIVLAMQDLVEDAKKIKDPPCGDPPHWPPYKDHPDKLVSEVEREHAALKKRYKEWLDENRHLSRSLKQRLSERGFINLWDEEAQVVDIPLDWGHKHGLVLNYEHATI